MLGSSLIEVLDVDIELRGSILSFKYITNIKMIDITAEVKKIDNIEPIIIKFDPSICIAC